MGANLSASWLQSSKKVQMEKRRERDGVKEDGEPCVWRRWRGRDGVGGCKGKDKIDGGKRD